MSARLPLVLCALLPANGPPLAPVITEPEVEGQIANPADVHMEVAGFSEVDAAGTVALTNALDVLLGF